MNMPRRCVVAAAVLLGAGSNLAIANGEAAAVRPLDKPYEAEMSALGLRWTDIGERPGACQILSVAATNSPLRRQQTGKPSQVYVQGNGPCPKEYEKAKVAWMSNWIVRDRVFRIYWGGSGGISKIARNYDPHRTYSYRFFWSPE